LSAPTAAPVDIAMVTLSTVRGDSRVIEEARALGARGLQVVVLSPRLSSVQQPAPADGGGVRFVELGARDWLAAGRQRGVRRRDPEAADRAIGVSAGEAASAAHPVHGILGRIREQRRAAGVRGVVAVAVQSVRARVRSRAFARTAAASVRRLGPAVVHCHDLPAAHWAIDWAPPGARIMYDAHEIYEELAGMPDYRRARYRRWQRDVAGRVDALIVANEGIGHYLRRQYPSLPEPVVVRNSHASIRREKAAVGRGDIRSDLGIPESASLAVYIGGVTRFRGLATLVESIPFVPSSWHVAVLGTGPLREPLMRRADALSPDARTRLHWGDPVPPEVVVDYVSSATVGLILYEPVCLNHQVATPNKLWEFAAAGLPIVASALPALASEIRTHDLGVVVRDAADPRCIGDALASLTPDSIRKHADAARRFCEKDSWESYVDRLLTVVEDLVAA
jgi:glycosyltransferase involved in cell wall biosynthesis